MAYDLGTSPGGHGYLRGGSTFPAFVEGFEAVALQNDVAVKALVDAVALAKPTLADGTDWNTLKTPAEYPINNPAVMVNAPPGETRAGVLKVFATKQPIVIQLFEAYGDGGTWRRTTGSVALDTWGSWVRISSNQRDTAATSAAQRNALVSRFLLRRGGRIGTNGKPVVALRFDHALNPFFAKILPLLKKYELPWVQAVFSDMLTDSTNNAHTWAQLEQAAVDNGGEIAVHSKTHLDATTEAGVFSEVVTSKTALTTAMPRLPLEQWIPPGVPTGPLPAGYMGYAPMQTQAQHYDTYAGRLIMQHYPVVTGYVNGIYRTLPSNMAIGQAHAILDAQTPVWADGVLRGLIDSGPNGLVFMLHPAYLDQPGYITTAQLEEVYANIAALRDAGEIEVLTHSGLYAADPYVSTRRRLPVRNGDFTAGLTGWAHTGNTVLTENGVAFARSGTTGSFLTQENQLFRHEQVFGASFELAYQVRAAGTATVKATVTNTVNPTKLTAFPDGGGVYFATGTNGWETVRQVFTLPLDTGGDPLKVEVGRASGGSVDITNIRIQAI